MEKKEINNLITKVGEGDELAMEQLYNGMSKVVYSFILTYVPNKHSAEDILQDVFIKLVRKPKVFKESDNGLAYMLTIAKNLSLNFIKKEKRSTPSTAEQIDVFMGSHEGSLEQNTFLKDFLKTLSEEERRVLILKEAHGFTFEEIHKLMKLSIATVKRRMAEVKKKFQVYNNNG